MSILIRVTDGGRADQPVTPVAAPDLPGRLPLIDVDSDDPTIREIFEFYAARGRPISGLYRTLGNAPAMLRAWTATGFPLRNETEVDRRYRELSVMRVALLTQSSFEWEAHWTMALEAGIERQALVELADWRQSGLFTDTDRIVLELTDALCIDGDVDDATFQRVVDAFGPAMTVELLINAAYYVCVSLVVKSLRIPLRAPDDPRQAVFRQALQSILPGVTDAGSGPWS